MRELDPGASALEYFGSELRRHRLAAGMSQDKLGSECLVSASLVGFFEKAQRVPSLDFMQRADATFGVDVFAAMWRLVARQSAHPSWFRQFAEIEASARLLRQFEPLAVPGLLQTEAYARAAIRAARPDYPAERVEELVAARMERQAILDGDDAPTLVVCLHEGVLTCPVGGVEVMAEQLEHLIEMSQRPKIVVQVVPQSVGAVAGLAGMFTIATLNNGDAEVVYFETVATGQLVDDGDAVAACVTAFEVLRGEALPREQSRELIRERAKEFE